MSSKWILFTYNIMFFILFGIYTTLYTQKIFSLQKLMPFDAMDILKGRIAYSGIKDFFILLTSKYVQ